jgi:predicted transcriptional regulator
MAESRRNDNKRKIEALEDEEVQKVREIAEKTAQDQAGLRRRLDALDKCTLLVVENSAKIEH